jgi:hypothetical protein
MASPSLIDRATGNRLMADKKGKWIKAVTKSMDKGALHRSLGVAEGDKIPKAKIEEAAKSDNPTLAKRARLAETFAKMRTDHESKGEKRRSAMYGASRKD